ncbi:helix-turn-helix domain-containing protein [Butyricicoccus faecihominis]|uniref:helix-turn-helix domain-containing protein n=1 Tax=Butyricicoccus faecihominis TaxID=1712515 RepID=UPI003AF3D845
MLLVIGEILQELRKDRHLEQAELAEAFGVSRSTISSYEVGRTEPPIEILCKYASFFNVSLDYICEMTRDLPNTYSAGTQFELENKEIYPLSNFVKDMNSLSLPKRSHLIQHLNYLTQLELYEKKNKKPPKSK